jgi:hypothetical protein
MQSVADLTGSRALSMPMAPRTTTVAYAQ